MYFFFIISTLNSAYKRNIEKLKGFWPDSSTKFTYSFPSVATQIPLPFSLVHKQSHTHSCKEVMQKPPHLCM